MGFLELVASLDATLQRDPRDPATPSGQRQVRLSKEEVRELVAEYQAGGTARDLAARWGINRHTVMEHVRRSGIPLRVQGVKKADLPDVIRLYELGLSLASIGERYGVAHTTIRKALLDAGIDRRKPWNRKRPSD